MESKLQLRLSRSGQTLFKTKNSKSKLTGTQ